ncbi:adenylyltransferase and sulfurtransferase MOCS3-like [Dysidea avara]|uniref:adenylyltransferase and sulfurtransferase MOCS3-like n=1 Tax=Dysidea avara TaxID=196820 RepID=UPI00332FE146
MASRLSNEEISRYGRQLILPEIGVTGQLNIQNSAVLIVGCGGLGCPIAQYLSAAGIGHLGLVDYDAVELGNLHRQVLHSEKTVGHSKVDSIKEAVTRLNSNVTCTVHHVVLSSSNAVDIIKRYDVIADATDNVATRYLINDSCVRLGKPLVSGSALRFEGQLTVYNFEGGPCYRCIFPAPPPAETVTSCSEGGVLGAVPGVIGNLQAIEIIKIVTGLKPSFSQKLLTYDAITGSFMAIKLRPRQPSCKGCGEHSQLSTTIDYVQWCGSGPDDKVCQINLLGAEDRISAHEYQSVANSNKPHLLVDVRPIVEYEICSLPNSINIPLATLQGSTELITRHLSNHLSTVYIVCRRGNDSQLAVQRLKHQLPSATIVKDLIGGLETWSREVDNSFPQY